MSAVLAAVRRSRAATWLLGAYLALSVVNLAAVLGGVRAAEVATKPLLMPLLAAFAVVALPARAPRRLVAAALVCGAVGDIALLWPAGFLIGMGAFAVGHVCYLVAFLRAGAFGRLRTMRLPLLYAPLWLLLTATVASRAGVLAVPIGVYSLLLIAMATCAAGLGRLAAIGGALFVVSDSLLGLGVAKLHILPSQSLWVMPTYLAAQLLLTLSWLANQDERDSAARSRRDAAQEHYAALAEDRHHGGWQQRRAAEMDPTG